MSPTQRTLQHLREAGYPLVQVVERWNPHARVRQDLFGIIDVVAVGADIVGVQATSGSNVSKRTAKPQPLRAAGLACGASGVFPERMSWPSCSKRLEVWAMSSCNVESLKCAISPISTGPCRRSASCNAWAGGVGKSFAGSMPCAP